MKCSACSSYVSSIKFVKGFTNALVEGTGSLKIGSVENHVGGDPLKKSNNLYLQETLGTEAYYNEVIRNSDIVLGIIILGVSSIATLKIGF